MVLVLGVVSGLWEIRQTRWSVNVPVSRYNQYSVSLWVIRKLRTGRNSPPGTNKTVPDAG